VGVFARDVEGVALLADALFGHDAADPATRPMPPQRLFDTAVARVPVRPDFAILQMPDPPEPAVAAAMAELAAVLGEGAFATPLPAAFAEAAAVRERINLAEMAKHYYSYERRGWDRLSDETRAGMTAGKAVPARDYLAALDWPMVLNAALDEIFERCDALLTPATPGPAPEGLGSTGSAIYNGVWTLCGLPVVTLPVFQTEDGLPLGLQVIGRAGDDARLLRTARWLLRHLTGDEGGGVRDA
jgi:aspartyl-tRNA(Asn)/glutamyl-tRNA(Gln) amidotransferase subunit A